MGVKEIRQHLYSSGIDPNYTVWKWHGEEDHRETLPDVNTGDPICDDLNMDTMEDVEELIDMVEAIKEDFTGNAEIFQKLLLDAEKPLYERCKKYTKLSAIVKLFNLKAKSGMSDKCFSNMLSIIADMLPDDNVLPSSNNEAKRCLSVFGMDFQKIHACPNDCILYRKEYKEAVECPTCGTSRFKQKKNLKEQKRDEGKQGVPAKVLWYFSPIPRFKRWFQSKETAKSLTWHADDRIVDGLLRHPADSPTWKLVDEKWPDFAAEPRNLRLALSTDGINPYSSLSSRYSCWPVMLNTYNFEPELCMKRKFTMLTTLISGPKQPGNNIDVYLAPLIEDLNTLWHEGVKAYDAFRQESFTLRAILLWTINDFPAYGYLSGSVVQGYNACPICSEKTYSIRLQHCGKCVYMGHRRYLPQNHPFRSQKKAFNGEQEFQASPEPLSGEQILIKVGRLKVAWGKKAKKVRAVNLKKSLKRKRPRRVANGVEKGGPRNNRVENFWKKKSIFFELPYWKDLPIRHNLDVMHIEKNVCDSIIGTLLNIPGKTKDGVKCRLDLEKMGLRSELAPQVNEKKTYLPPACYTLSREERKMFCQTLHDLKVPNGYSSNFRSHVSMEDLKLYGLKSHDCHILMQQLLPIAIRSVLPKHVRYAIMRVCFFFNALCAKVVDFQKLKEIQNEIVITLCLLEKYFPPSFFDIMVHLMVHLVREVELCGPVFFRWMYPIERLGQFTLLSCINISKYVYRFSFLFNVLGT